MARAQDRSRKPGLTPEKSRHPDGRLQEFWGGRDAGEEEIPMATGATARFLNHFLGWPRQF